MIKGTIGQLLINDALPEDLRDYSRVLDKKGITTLFREVAKRYPERYKQILQDLQNHGADFASTKGISVSLRHLVPGKHTKAFVDRLKAENQADIDNDELDDDTREKQIVARTSKYYTDVENAVMKDQEESGSPYLSQVRSGGRGNPAQLNQMAGAELLVADHKNNLVPIPLYSSYAEGVPPAEYWGSVYGTRRGSVSTKFATAESGFFGKQLALAAHRLVVNRDRPYQHRLPVGLPVDVDDDGNIGSVLAKDAGPYKAGEILTPRILAELKDKDINEILVHSPMTASDEDGGLDAWSAGVRDTGGMSRIGDNIGIPSAQAMSEPISQGALSEKHSAGGGKIGKKLGGFDYINKLFQAPEFFQEAAPLAPMDGIVKEVREAPQGGSYITVGDQELYVHPQHQVTVKPGQHVETGDDLTDGYPHPRDLVKYRGVGEARRTFLNMAMQAFKDSGIKVHRRNVEPIVTGMINHVVVTDPNGAGDHILDDVVQYNRMAANYVPRDGVETIDPHKAVGRYLEEPALHYSVGTPITKKVAENLKKWGIADVAAHKDAPPFQSHWERLMTSTSQDPDWQTRLGGFYIGKSLVQSIHEGAKSDPRGTSFFPAVAQGVGFGEDLTTKGTY